MYQAQLQPSFGLNQPPLAQDSLHQGTDPNSPELFKQNLALARQEVIRLQALSREVLSGIENAYYPGTSPARTSALTEELKQVLRNLIERMRQTGVGSLPLLPSTTPSGALINPPSEAQLLADAGRGVQALYESLKRKQESAAVAANLLGSDVQRR